jgi:hypothetical protein
MQRTRARSGQSGSRRCRSTTCSSCALFKMLPHLAIHNTNDRRVVDAELLCQHCPVTPLGHAHIAMPNAADLRIGQLRTPMTLTSGAPLLLDLVTGIVCIRSQKEMIRANAPAVVTLMQYPESVRNSAPVENPGDPVSVVVSPVDPESTITTSGSPHVDPAGAEFGADHGSVAVDHRPETGGDLGGGRKLRVHRGHTSVVPLPGRLTLGAGAFTSPFYGRIGR